MKLSQIVAMAERINRHAANLKRLFPKATEPDGVQLYEKLRRLELKAGRFALRLCNGPEFESEEAQEKAHDAILASVQKLLGPGAPIMLNQDPRGYALKIPDGWLRDHPKFAITKDWGGYGILAPDFSEG